MSTTPDVFTIARWLVEKRGLSVIPLQPRGKRPATKWQAFQQARPSIDNLRAWFTADSSRNLGIVCGAISDLVAVDCDSAAAIAWANAHLPATQMRTITARGEHRFYRHPGRTVSNAAHVRTGDVELALDIRADGGFVVAPGSIHETGHVYARAGIWPPVDQLPVFDPAWIAETAITRPPPPDAAPATDRETLLARAREYLLRVPPAIEGDGGDAHTYRLCCRLVRGFALMDDEALDLLRPWNARCLPPWSEDELRDKLHNARAYGDEPIGGRRDAPRPGGHAPTPPAWPAPLGGPAYYGLLGEIVQTIAPETESDPVGLLVQLLVMLGNIIGRSAHFVVEACHHYLNEFVLLVGNTSKARKGTSYEYAERLYREIDPLWTRASGLSSGEGLIWSVRDPVVKTSDKKIAAVDDPGVVDKRLLVFESELASTLHMMDRSGNTLGDVMKNAWDGRPLGTLTKREPTKATGAHISVIAHITTAELLRYLTRTEIANGWANRFLVVCVKRARVLPLGGQVVDLTRFRSALADVVRFASTRERTEPITLDAAAEARWCAIYPRLSADRPGLVGAMNARGEAHARRLAALYTLTDQSTVVALPHLEAALELSRYVFDSLVYIFGDSLGDSAADTILRAVRAAPDGLTRTEIADLFSRHRSGDVASALGLLVSLQLIACVQESTGGRPIERWRASKETE